MYIITFVTFSSGSKSWILLSFVTNASTDCVVHFLACKIVVKLRHLVLPSCCNTKRNLTSPKISYICRGNFGIIWEN